MRRSAPLRRAPNPSACPCCTAPSLLDRLPTPIQAEAVPLILGGGDVMAAAETGSGKTGAFALPVLQVVHEALRMRQRSMHSSGGGSGGSGGTAAAESAPVGPPPCVLNAEDRDDVMAIAPGGLRCQARSEAAWGGCRGTLGAFGGRVYFEATVSDEGLCRCGVAGWLGRWMSVTNAGCMAAARAQHLCLSTSQLPHVDTTPARRVGWSAQPAALDLGTDRHGFGYGGTGKKSHSRSFEDYGEASADSSSPEGGLTESCRNWQQAGRGSPPAPHPPACSPPPPLLSCTAGVRFERHHRLPARLRGGHAGLHQERGPPGRRLPAAAGERRRMCVCEAGRLLLWQLAGCRARRGTWS